MVRKTRRATLQEHLATGRKLENPDEVIDLFRRRLGFGGIGVITSTGDDRLPNDFRYELFVDQPSRRYERVDLDGRATHYRGSGITIFNSIEIEVQGVDVNVIGMQRDTELEFGQKYSETSLLELGRILLPENVFAYISHPFFRSNAGNQLRKGVEESNLDMLTGIDGINVYNAEAALPYPGSWFANAKALDLFRDLKELNPDFAGIIDSDGHSRWWELARFYTTISDPGIINDDEDVFVNGELAVTNLRNAFQDLSYKQVAAQIPSRFDLRRFFGVTGAAWHGYDLTVLHSKRLEKDTKVAQEYRSRRGLAA